MKSLCISTASLAAAALSTVMLIAGCDATYGYGDKVVSATDNQLTTSNDSGMEQETHEVAADAKITLDGNVAELTELEQGDSVTVKVEQRDGKDVATEITAQSKENVDAANPQAEAPTGDFEPRPAQPGDDRMPSSDFAPLQGFEPPADPEDGAPRAAVEKTEEKSLDGKISSVSDDHLKIKDDDAAEHMVKVNDDTKYTLDGAEATHDDMMAGQSVAIEATMDGGEMTAKSVAATSP